MSDTTKLTEDELIITIAQCAISAQAVSIREMAGLTVAVNALARCLAAMVVHYGEPDEREQAATEIKGNLDHWLTKYGEKRDAEGQEP